MAKVAARGTLPSIYLQCGGDEMKANSGIRRKTPSELRGEQLRRTDVVEAEDESSVPHLGVTSSENCHGLMKPDIPRNPRYVEARMDEVYPAKKFKFNMLSGKENAKESLSTGQPGNLRSLSLMSNISTKIGNQVKGLNSHTASSEVAKDDMMRGQQTKEKFSQNVFRSVTELSSHSGRVSDLHTLVMDKALKGLVTRKSSTLPGSREDSPETACNSASVDLGNFYSESQISMPKAPLDLTLKTSARIVCSFSMKWLHRLLTCGAYYTMPQFTSQFSCSEGQNINYSLGSASSASSLNLKALHSWVYPQSPLPSSLISALNLSARDGVEIDFLSKRQSAWEDAFRSLYYMLRKNVCHIFYVCTPHFVVMFTADGSGKIQNSCNAYISQSSRHLRALLKKHDVCFSMPLCHSEAEQVTAEDLVELSEIEKHNLGQTRHANSSCDIDNEPQSLLAFIGNHNAQGLYDFLLNYRCIMTYLAGMDVPVLYSPVPFQNAALSTPEIQYMETKTTDQISAPPMGSDLKEPGSVPVPSSGLCCSIEFKDAYLPPWIISSICATVSSEGNNFEASFTTEPTSAALNVALQTIRKETEFQATGSESFLESKSSFGIQETTVTPHLYSSTMKGLKYCNGSYTASLFPV